MSTKSSTDNVFPSNWFFGNVECNLDNPVKKFGDERSTPFAQSSRRAKKENILKKKAFNNFFLWTRSKQFQKPFLEFLTMKAKTFAGGQKRIGKLYYFFRQIYFCSKHSLGHVDCSFRDHIETFLANSRKCFTRCPKILRKKLFLRENFGSNG